eukprot:SAG31_NODE_23767_length_496_cov_1.158690_1_plen_43_part_01
MYLLVPGMWTKIKMGRLRRPRPRSRAYTKFSGLLNKVPGTSYI